MTSTLTPETIEQIYELLTVSETPNGDTHNMEFISDPAHGWLKVPHLAYQLAGAPASPHSYTDGEFCYLEEDSDAPRFLDQVGITVRPDGGGLERDGGSWYIPSRELQHQRRYNEVSPRDMKRLHDPAYVNPFAAETPALFATYPPCPTCDRHARYGTHGDTCSTGLVEDAAAADKKFLDDHFQIIHIR
jgi:hypothetical protein